IEITTGGAPRVETIRMLADAGVTRFLVPPLAMDPNDLPAGRPAAEVKVKVANATNTPGLAAKVRDILQGRGYTQTTIGDSPNKQLTTDVFFLPGWEAEARSVALALGLGPNVVRPMPEPPPISPGDAAILILAGVDLA
ncbi:MAG: LytR C-terminal domain-containing protein, partial [Actinomycetales bacterium]